MSLFLQIFVIGCFVVVVVALFLEKTDYLTYSIAATLAAVTMIFILTPEEINLEDLFVAIDWPVIFFLISLFTIVAILDEAKIFQEVARRLTTKFKSNTRKFFWIMCLTSTITAAFIEDISVAIIFIPMIISTSEKMKINPAPILLGMTICINLAATLTPFGSAQNLLIASQFGLSTAWFFVNLGPFFILGTFTTLLLLDRFILKKHIKDIWVPHCVENDEPIDEAHFEEHELVILEDPIDKNLFIRNILALVLFIVVLMIIPSVLFVGLFGMVVFVFLNPRKTETGKKRPDVSHFLKKVDFKLVFFFICLFTLVYCLEVVGILKILEDIVVGLAPSSIFLLCVFVLVITSLFSGLIDNIPVTVLFIPIIQALVTSGYAATPLLIAFILGINLGGNFLPQGSAPDMMTLELSKKYCVDDMSYKRLFKVGGLFALYHILLGIGYLAFMIFFFY